MSCRIRNPKKAPNHSIDLTMYYSVADFKKVPGNMRSDYDDAFKEIENLSISRLRQDAMKWLIDELEILTKEELVEYIMVFRNTSFDGFDSPNGFHASAYWNIEVWTEDFGFAMELKSRFDKQQDEIFD